MVSVDGVNVITGQTADPSQSGYVLSPRGGLDILGWRKNLSQTAAFYFTALPDSYAARTGRPDNVGVIGVALFRRKAQPLPLPQPYGQVAPSAPRSAGIAKRGGQPAPGQWTIASAPGTVGRRIRPRVHVTFERATSAPAEVHHALLRQPRQPARARHHPRSGARRAAAAALPGLRSRSRRVNS